MARQRTRKSSQPASFEIAPPPRDVPLSIKIRLLSGGSLNQIGWGLFAFGSLMFWALGANADISDWTTLRGKLAHTTGRVTSIKATGFSSGDGDGAGSDSRQSSRNVQAIHYEFTDASGVKFEGCSYGQAYKGEPGKRIDIEYRPDDPSRSRAMGLRAAPLPAPAIFVVALPMVGMFMAFTGLRKGILQCRLLCHGKPALAERKTVTKTNVQINDQTVYKFIFEFKTDDGQLCTFEHRTHETADISDDDRERILYNPADPRQAHPFDNLPGAPTFNAMGGIQSASGISAMLSLIFPVVAVSGNAIYLLSMI